MSTVTNSKDNTETTLEIVDIETEIERIKGLLTRETDKKLQVIRLYLQMYHDVSTSIATIDDLTNFIRTEDLDADLIIGIFDVLDQTFSRGYPNFIFEYPSN